MKRLRIALSGVGGFGRVHAESAQILAKEGLVDLVAFAEPVEGAPAAAELCAAGARRYHDFYEMLAAESELDLVCVATPIHHHVPMARAALERGLHVFVEKPPAVRIQDLRELIALQQRSGCFCAVGFHDVARPPVITLKHRLCEGAIGAIHAIHAEARWSRPASYYARSDWAGRTRMNNDFILDGPMNNSCAHVINLAAYLAGPEPYEFAKPLWVQGELYRANDIEGEDTNCLRALTDTGVEICVHITQCAAENHPRTWTIIGDTGVARLHDHDGVILPLERIEMDERERPTLTLMRRLIEVILGSDEPLLMPLAESEGFLLISNGAYESSRKIHRIPPQFIQVIPHNGSSTTTILDIDHHLLEAAATGRLLSEYEVPWAVPTLPYDVSRYTEFPTHWNG
ncbi:MAG: Gfo/Idh/MocA family oxidoreductase [Candidatus Hydrogenedentes bacterium]|nr:Gfo/Idh/MocA family oxidoreductase [Candidatus Hydrogenedentota bacterium]